MASVDEVGNEAGCYGAVEAVFEEASVGAAFAGCVGAVAVVYEDFHFCRVLWVCQYATRSRPSMRALISLWYSGEKYGATLRKVRLERASCGVSAG